MLKGQSKSTPTLEERLYRFLKDREGRAVSFQEFATLPPFDVKGNLRVTVHFLRKRLPDIDPNAQIVTVPQWGYRLEVKNPQNVQKQ